jgi:hypothetical protein
MSIFDLLKDYVWLILLELAIFLVFVDGLLNDIRARIRKSSCSAKVTRGSKSWSILFTFWALAIILVEIIISSEIISEHRVIIGLANTAILVYLNLFSGCFRNRIIGWWIKLEKMEEKV